MNWKTWVPLLLAIVLGLVAMKVARDVMSKNQFSPAADSGRPIVVLNKDLPAGTQVTAEDLASTRVSGDVNMSAIFTQNADVEGRVLTSAAIKGAPLLQTMLAPKGIGAGLQSLIPDGMRALTIQIDEFTGVAGNLNPGCRIDIVATFPGEGGEMVSRTVVQNIKVQSLGLRRPPEANGNEGGGGIRSVTLLATPHEAETIELAAQSRHRLVLRGATDNEMASSDGVTVSELRGGVAAGGSGRDPFAIAETGPQPVTPVVQTSTGAPTTQPQQALQTGKRRDRQIRIIRGGVESITTVPEIAQPVGPKWMTEAGTDDLPGNENH